MKRIKILYISHSSSISGGEICLLNLLKYLDRTCFDSVVVLPSQGPLLDEFKRLEVNTYLSPLEWWIRLPSDFGLKSSSVSIRLEEMSKIIEREKPDLIHTNTSVIWEGALSAKMKSIPHIWHIHEILDKHPSLKPLFPLPLVYLAMTLLSERIVVVSNTVREKLLGVIPIEKLTTIYNGIDTERFRRQEESSVRQELSIPENEVIAVSIGSLQKEKGYNDLIEAIALVKKDGGNAKFLIVGEGSHEAVQLIQDRIKTLGLSDCVSYLGYRRDIPRILLDSDFLIISSISEAFPVVCLEAMAAGKPVVATNCGGISEMISEGESGFLVPVNDPKALSLKILYMLKNRTRMNDMGKKALKEVSEHYGVRTYATNFENLYKEIFKNNSREVISEKENILIEALMEIYEDLSKEHYEIFEIKNRIKNILSSRSWRITAPLRRTRGIIDSLLNRWFT